MYRLDRDGKRLEPLRATSFAEHGLRERSDLQEWIARDPSVLGEEFLIIQKEFSGFDNTNERLDLLALDRDANLVVIENKLDDSGRDVTWQALKYASYCSQLTRDNIRDMFQDYLLKGGRSEAAEAVLADFFEVDDLSEVEFNPGFSQRVVLVAGSFRREVTSTVMWLLNHRVRIQCIKVTPYLLGKELILGFEQVIPVKDAEEFLIGIAEKGQDDASGRALASRRDELAYRFWQRCLPALQAAGMYQGVSAGRTTAIMMGSGLGGFSYNLVINSRGARAEVYLSRASREENKAIFDLLLAHREEIERACGEALTWERLDARVASRVRCDLGVGLEDEERWGEVSEFFVSAMGRLKRAVDPFVDLAARAIQMGDVPPSWPSPE